jgi:Holliday junction DNA helicase RuvB
MSWNARIASVAEAMGLSVSPPAPPPMRQPPRRERERTGRARRVSRVVDMIGQDEARTRLVVRVRGARLRNEHPGHVLLYGPPGLGKTTLAEIVAHETGGELVRAVGSQLSTPNVLARTLSELSTRRVDVLFIDEIHALPRVIEELLYMAMEDGRIEIKVGSGQDAQIKSVPLPSFILVGATTLPGWLSQPLRDRFASSFSLEFYSEDELTRIVQAHAEDRGAKLDPEAAVVIGRRSRGTPRIALRLFMAAWDFTVAMAESTDVPITVETAEQALALEGVDAIGLDRDDLRLLRTVCQQYRGGPIGLRNLAATLGMDERTVSAQIEPYLLRAGLLRISRRGRAATEAAFAHLALDVPFSVDDESQHSSAPWEDRDY